MKRQQKKFTLYALAGLLVVLGFAAGAPRASALTISPPAIEFSVIPGNQAEFVVKLYNEGDQQQRLFVNATTFTSGAEDGIPVYDFSAPKEDIATWVNYDNDAIVLEPQGRKEITITINVPADASPGGHYGIVAFSTTPPTGEGSEKPQVAVSQGVGTLMLVRVEGEITESATISNFAMQGLANRLPATLTTSYNNTGNIHLKPAGKVVITDMFKRTAVTLDVNAKKTSTLPNSSRSYDVTWEKGTVKQTATNSWSRFWEEYSNERSNFGIGKYTATVALTAGQSGAVATSATTSFWLFPWHVLLVWGVGLVVLILVLIVLVKRYNHWVVAKAQSSKNQNPPTGTA